MWKVCLLSALVAVHCRVQDKTEGAEESRIGLDELVDIAFPPTTPPPYTSPSHTYPSHTYPPHTSPPPYTSPPYTPPPHTYPPNTSTSACQPGYECVPYYLCSASKTVVEDGKGLINLRSGFEEEEFECEEYLDECCATSKTTDEYTFTIAPTFEGCGFRNVDGVGFKVSGTNDREAQFGEFPWMVAILTEEVLNDQVINLYNCGGSLIAPDVVLTAAHCVESKMKMKVRAGEWDTQTHKEILAHQDRNVIEVIIHPYFDNGTAFNDVALLFLESGFKLDAHISPVCLPPPNYDFDYAECFSTGWGKDNFLQTGKYAAILKKIDLKVVPNRLCQRQLRHTILGKHFKLHPSFVCAGGEPEKDACTGDGGSPLVCPIPHTQNRYYQAGIVAWGVGCGQANVPGVYASVAKLQPWIEQHLHAKAIDHAFYVPQ